MRISPDEKKKDSGVGGNWWAVQVDNASDNNHVHGSLSMPNLYKFQNCLRRIQGKCVGTLGHLTLA